MRRPRRRRMSSADSEQERTGQPNNTGLPHRDAPDDRGSSSAIRAAGRYGRPMAGLWPRSRGAGSLAPRGHSALSRRQPVDPRRGELVPAWRLASELRDQLMRLVGAAFRTRWRSLLDAVVLLHVDVDVEAFAALSAFEFVDGHWLTPFSAPTAIISSAACRYTSRRSRF